MAHVPRPSFTQVSQAAATGIRNWWARETTDALRRRLSVLVMVVALGTLGPFFIALPIFPDPATAISGESDGGPCAYDAAPAAPPDRLRGPAPIAVVSGVTTTLPFDIRNTGTCPWDGATTLRREDSHLIDASQTITPAGAVASDGVFRADITFAVPPVDNVLLNILYRMHAPDDRSFGAPIEISLITYPLGGQPKNLQQRNAGSDIVNLIWMALPGILGFGLAIYHAGRFTWDFYSLKSVWYGVGFVLRRLFNLGPNVTATVKDGRIDWDSTGGAKKERENDVLEKIGGLGTLSVHSGMEVLLERGARYSRIVGPGATPLGVFERIRTVFDARQRNRKKDESAYTKDGIPITTEATVSFKLMKQMNGEEIAEPMATVSFWQLLLAWLGFKVKMPAAPARLPASSKAVRAMVYEMPAGVNWESTVSSDIDKLIAAKMLDELWAPEPDMGYTNPRREMVDELLNKGKESLRKRGIELIDINIGPLNVPDDVVERRREWWQAFWKKDKRITEAEGEAEAFQVLELARAEARTRMIQAITQGLLGPEPVSKERLSQVIALRFIDAVESIAGVWLSDENRADYLKILQDLRKLSGPTDRVEEGHGG